MKKAEGKYVSYESCCNLSCKTVVVLKIDQRDVDVLIDKFS